MASRGQPVSEEPDADDDVGGDPACWAHLFDEDEEAAADAPPDATPERSGDRPR
jgi:hypothetical protein